MGHVDNDTMMFVAVIVLLGFLYWLHYRKQQHFLELKRKKYELFNKSLEKFGEAQEFVNFMKGKEGQALLFNGEIPVQNRPRTVLRFLQVGVMLAVIAVGCFITAYVARDFPGPDARDMYIGFNVFGMVVASLGVGLFVVAVITSLWERMASRTENS